MFYFGDNNLFYFVNWFLFKTRLVVPGSQKKIEMQPVTLQWSENYWTKENCIKNIYMISLMSKYKLKLPNSSVGQL